MRSPNLLPPPPPYCTSLLSNTPAIPNPTTAYLFPAAHPLNYTRNDRVHSLRHRKPPLSVPSNFTNLEGNWGTLIASAVRYRHLRGVGYEFMWVPRSCDSRAPCPPSVHPSSHIGIEGTASEAECHILSRTTLIPFTHRCDLAGSYLLGSSKSSQRNKSPIIDATLKD